MVLAMRSALLVLAALIAGCSTDASGLGGDLVLDATTDDTSSSSGDETKPLFPDEDTATGGDTAIASDSGPAADTELPDTELPDTGLPDTELPDTELPDTGLPDTGDTSVAVDSSADVAPETIAIDAPGSDGALTPTPGSVTCADRVCPAGEDCCGTSGGFTCAGTCPILSNKFRCDEKADCPSGQICCAEVTPFVGSWYGTTCTASWSCFSAQVCTSSAGCDSGKTCTAIKPSGAPTTMGYCK